MPSLQYQPNQMTSKVSELKFSMQNDVRMRECGVMEVKERKLNRGNLYGPYLEYSPLDSRLGLSVPKGTCSTCNLPVSECPGHFGYINLELPVFHYGFFKHIIRVLQSICKSCSHILLSDEKKRMFFKKIRLPSLTYLHKVKLHRQITNTCKLCPVCFNCGYKNGIVKSVPRSFMKIMHDRSKIFGHDRLRLALEKKPHLGNFNKRAKVTLINPVKALRLFENIPNEDLIFLVMDENGGHPMNMISQRFPVPPASIRPSVPCASKLGSTEDDLTMKLSEIVFVNMVIKRHRETGCREYMYRQSWEYLQVLCALYINSDISYLPKNITARSHRRCLFQRLKGKMGRFRKNLSGKRVNYSSRTVISPDPNLRVDQIGVPVQVAKQLTFPDRITERNRSWLQKLVQNGPEKHPGALFYISSETGVKKSLRFANREHIAQTVKLGDTVERHMVDGDYVLFNRQPSLHKQSIMCHQVKVLPYRTFRFNECSCTPYNADFDGDEMNVHFPQTHEARAESVLLMNIKDNVITSRNGEPLIAPTQDFITGAYLLTRKDCFFGKLDAWRIVGAILHAENGVQHVDLPMPAILKPIPLWTGKQLFNLVLRPNRQCNVLLNLTAKGKNYKGNLEMCPNEGYVIIRNSCLLTGVMDKSMVGSGSKIGVIYALLRDYGSEVAMQVMWRISRVAIEFLTHHGFSIGIDDLMPNDKLIQDKKRLIKEGYDRCDGYIEEFKSGLLSVHPGCSEEDTLEAIVLRELSDVRNQTGQACFNQLNVYNSPLTMAMCGSKGSVINISQMIACVGQQAIAGRRPTEGFQRRSLPHFMKNDKSPVARGFVEASFFTGLEPCQFFFHTMAGREGLIDSAVKTAETGYMQRRLVKCMEDLCVHYDETVRNAKGSIIQFAFGQDGIDPMHAETDSVVVNLEHLWEHCRNVNLDDKDRLNHKEMLGLVMEKFSHPFNCSGFFLNAVKTFCGRKAMEVKRVVELTERCRQHAGDHCSVRTAVCGSCYAMELKRKVLVKEKSVSERQFVGFLEECQRRYQQALIHPGTAVGAISATSIGEPSTQMTLKTFHFAGVASMNITQGVPRIREIINAAANILTPVVTCSLVDESSASLAHLIKGRLERTTLNDITEMFATVFGPKNFFLTIKLSTSRIRLLQLEITPASVVRALLQAKLKVPLSVKDVALRGDSIIIVYPPEGKNFTPLQSLYYLKNYLPKVIVHGLPSVKRCIIQADEQTGEKYKLLVETRDYLSVIATEGVDTAKTVSNHPIDVAKVLGIEAAREVIITEIMNTMAGHGIGLDFRHVMMLADLMTNNGEVVGMTRFGLPKIKDSVLLLASFENTCEHLFNAAYHGHQDNLSGVSESIIMGVPISIGTGMFGMMVDLKKPKLAPGTSIFQQCLKEIAAPTTTKEDQEPDD
ncbi:DNA-directed RNA polymerase III subunit RPC1 [Trichinella spiralis]|uniref:DNA-directed RNA polymerase subunit n=1 Tax=Trichinella spiralis TaxID=6334 RepID=A0A0V1BY00_TRISP|nr:DNA-directed RNA polymerase III subunit RPC1 [Trichinella spiralis]